MESLDSMPDILTIGETAEILRVSRSTVGRLVRRNQLPSLRIGRRVLIAKEQLVTWLQLSGDREQKNERAHCEERKPVLPGRTNRR